MTLTLILKVICILACLGILACQLYKAKRTTDTNVEWQYHALTACMCLGVACEIFEPIAKIHWTDVFVLGGILGHQLYSLKRWSKDVPPEYKTSPAPLTEMEL